MNATLLTRLTALHLRTIKGYYVGHRKVILPDGREQEVNVFAGNECLFLGQFTPLGTIVIHEAVFNDRQLLEYVVAHEAAHKRQWWKCLMIPLALLVIWQAPGVLASSLTLLGQAFLNGNFSALADFPLGMVVGISLLAVPNLFSWLLELDADFQSIRTIGLQSFLDIKNRERSATRSSLSFRAVFNFLTHPPSSLTVRIWKNTHHRDNGKYSGEENYGQSGDR